MTSRLPQTPRSAGGASYQGVLLTTITRAPSDPKVPTQGSLADASTSGERKTRNRSASLATELLGFVRGGANEVIPRLELRVLERPRASQFYGLVAQRPGVQRHSLAAAPRQEDDKEVDTQQGEDEDYSPRTSAFARSQALSQLTSKRSSAASKPALRRGISAVTSVSAYRASRRERRDTGATTTSARSVRSQMSRRVSMPTVTNGFKSRRPSVLERRLSLALSSMRGRRYSTMQPDEDENDIVGEMNSRVHNITDARHWILAHRPSVDNNAVAQDIMDDNRPVSSMRRPTYAASVFQQARLMEAERQAGVAAAVLSGSAIDLASVNASATQLPPGTPMLFGPRTPGFFPKTPATAFPQGIVEI
ncbi:hypothetical protein NDA16_002659 [Ustilago loliicola]|nr:hypothetical protein NDA16_002659 [Ustilago loliicola]